MTEKELNAKYIVESGKIGVGGFSKIKKVQRRSDSTNFAMKIVKKKVKCIYFCVFYIFSYYFLQ